MLGLFKKKAKPTDEQIKQDRQKWLDDMLVRSAKLQKLIGADDTGWKEFVALLDDYVDKCKRRKIVTALDTASDETIDVLKKLDHEVWFIGFIRNVPAQFIKGIENKIQAIKKEEEDGAIE